MIFLVVHTSFKKVKYIHIGGQLWFRNLNQEQHNSTIIIIILIHVVIVIWIFESTTISFFG